MGNEKGTVVAAITPSGCFILVRITIYLLFGARATSPPREAFVASTGKPGMSFLPPDSPSVPRELSRVKKNFSQPPNHSFSVLRYRRVVYFIMKKYMKLKEIEGAARKNGERSYGNVENCVVSFAHKTLLIYCKIYRCPRSTPNNLPAMCHRRLVYYVSLLRVQ